MMSHLSPDTSTTDSPAGTGVPSGEGGFSQAEDEEDSASSSAPGGILEASESPIGG